MLNTNSGQQGSTIWASVQNYETLLSNRSQNCVLCANSAESYGNGACKTHMDIRDVGVHSSVETSRRNRLMLQDYVELKENLR